MEQEPMGMIQLIDRIIPHRGENFIYEILRDMTPGLCVDVGAAAGLMTRLMRLAGDRDTRVVAFEPFPGNHPYFIQSTSDLSNVRLIKKAVSDTIGSADLIVPSTVQGTEPGWEKYRGYSSTGFLGSLSLKRRLRHTVQIFIKSLARGSATSDAAIISVETTTLDATFPGERIDFLKIDVQGAEKNVLLGAQGMLRDNKVVLLFIEWRGEVEVIDLLTHFGYELFATSYVGSPRDGDVQRFEALGFNVTRPLRLSTGKVAYEMVFRDESSELLPALRTVKQKRLGWIKTDLIAVSEPNRNRFMEAAEAYSRKQAVGK